MRCTSTVLAGSAEFPRILTDEPVQPIEYRSVLMVRGTSDEGEEGLKEAESHCDEAKQRVRIGVKSLPGLTSTSKTKSQRYKNSNKSCF